MQIGPLYTVRNPPTTATIAITVADIAADSVALVKLVPGEELS